jgi:hypothetical protein
VTWFQIRGYLVSVVLAPGFILTKMSLVPSTLSVSRDFGTEFSAIERFVLQVPTPVILRISLVALAAAHACFISRKTTLLVVGGLILANVAYLAVVLASQIRLLDRLS